MSLLQHLPGLELPVGKVSSELSRMWQVDRHSGSPAVSEFRASQMNLILHFGIATTSEEARERFDTAIRFGQRYPCRIIVLCPLEDAPTDGEEPLEAKLFTQCYLGKSLREMCCCEALMLSYPTREFIHLRNQVTVWLEADLPTYHWFHRVPPTRIVDQYLEFSSRFRRILYDSRVEGDAYADIAWPNPQAVVDISTARLLPIKQSLGPFLSGFPPGVLVRGLEAVVFRGGPSFAAILGSFQSWVETSLRECVERAEGEEPGAMDIRLELDEAKAGQFGMYWKYGDNRYLSWEYDMESREARIHADLGGGTLEVPQILEPISEVMALSESLFF